jgi:hypothetical protein
MSEPDASVTLRCDCSDLGHLIVFDAWHWDTDKPPHSQLLAHMELEALPWLRRIGIGLRYIITGKTAKWWWVDNVITDARADALRRFLEDYLDSSLNALAAGSGTAQCEASQSGLVPAPKGKS